MPTKLLRQKAALLIVHQSLVHQWDPHVTKSNEESQGNTVTNKDATHSTPVDPDNQLTKPDKDIDHNDAQGRMQDFCNGVSIIKN